MRILLTGASGLLGSHLVPLLASEHEIFSLGRTPISGTEHLPSVDLSMNWTSDLLPTKMDTVIHLAQSSRYRDFPDGAEDVFQVNLSSTGKLLEYARRSGATRFIAASTGGIYRPGIAPLSEDSEILGPSELGYYYSTKLASEMLAATYRPFMDIHILRIFFMYGLGQRQEMFLPSLISKVRNQQAVFLNGNEGIRVNPVRAADVARSLIKLIEEGGPETINVAGPYVASIKEIATHIGARVAERPRFEIIESRPDIVADTECFDALLDQPAVEVIRGLDELLTIERDW